MEGYDIYRDIAERTQGDIYIGVVGPVRTGKSTFIKRFMDILVLPNLEEAPLKERIRDELPQSAAGKTIMTTEPKFVPEKAVEITINENTRFKVRLVDTETINLAGELEKKYDTPVIVVNGMQMEIKNIYKILEKVLFEFPIREIAIDFPTWVDALDKNHWFKENVLSTVKESVKDLYRLRFKSCRRL